MKNNYKDSNAPPQIRGTDLPCKNVYTGLNRYTSAVCLPNSNIRKHCSKGWKALEDFVGFRFARGTPVGNKKKPVVWATVINVGQGKLTRYKMSVFILCFFFNDSAFRQTGRLGPPELQNNSGVPVLMVFQYRIVGMDYNVGLARGHPLKEWLFCMTSVRQISEDRGMQLLTCNRGHPAELKYTGFCTSEQTEWEWYALE